jgi:hypothetical protein
MGGVLDRGQAGARERRTRRGRGVLQHDVVPCGRGKRPERRRRPRSGHKVKGFFEDFLANPRFACPHQAFPALA